MWNKFKATDKSFVKKKKKQLENVNFFEKLLFALLDVIRSRCFYTEYINVYACIYVSFNGSPIWNSLPLTTQDCNTYTFKVHLKNWLKSNQTCTH